MPYGGSEAATIADAHEYRVKDLAAFYRGLVAVVPYEAHKDRVERDRAIARLRALVDERWP